ncbi:MAG: preprotein translocase subunit SecA [Proteobacteria bacterium]|nr:preprotein translocase subunit SecA [Pseudomonadota bacterium]
MISGLVKKVFGSRNERLLKRYRGVVEQINALEPAFEKISDEEIRAKTNEFRKRCQNGESLDDLLPEAFALVREASKRVFKMRHYDVQMIGGMALHYGKIAEMRTGEGKTLVSTLPAYLNALGGAGVHVVTVNEYLAERDANWMGRLHRFLGLTVGVNLSSMSHEQKQMAYKCDITYGTNNEFGFDYLRDNMVYQINQRVQLPLNYAIIDEVDSILIDEARTPLIISGQADDTTEIYVKIDHLSKSLKRQEVEDGPGDFWVDEKAHQVLLTEEGHEHAERLLEEAGLLQPGGNLYDASSIQLMHHLYAALRAHALYHRDQHYVVLNKEIVIVDEFTGRMMAGRRWSDSLHQAVEAKEGVPIQKENQTLASITFQNYFRLYGKLGGMTGTADTEAFEFQQIYSLETVVIPTHRPMVRKDQMDQVYCSAREKYDAIIKDIQECYERGQPVLVGTTSIENSELLSEMLNKVNLKHQVLNAKQHESEAHIIAQAGRPKMITIATNMAGRGTDIVLGGSIESDLEVIRNDESLDEAAKLKREQELKAKWQGLHEEVLNYGGLHIIGTERHESRRVDNQLRGRAGRQGDVGSSRFYLSLEDPLLRIFASDRVAAIMTKLKLPDGEAIEHPWVTRAIENAQRKVEERNFEIRKQLLEYDDVANDQRKVIYQQRNELLEADDISDTILAMREDVLRAHVESYVPAESMEEEWDIQGLETSLENLYKLKLSISQWLVDEPDLHAETLCERIIEAANAQYETKEASVGGEVMRHFERSVMLQSLDQHWREHLAALDHLRQGIHLRGYAQVDPKQAYKRESFELFSMLLETIKREVTQITLTVQVQAEDDVNNEADPSQVTSNIQFQHADYDLALGSSDPVEKIAKVGRNDPCPCGSGRKYKHCHGKLS